MKQKISKKDVQRSFQKCMEASLILSVDKVYSKQNKIKIVRNVRTQV